MLNKGFFVLLFTFSIVELKIKTLPTENALWQYFWPQGCSQGRSYEEMVHVFNSFLMTCEQLEQLRCRNERFDINVEQNYYSYDPESPEGSEFSSPRRMIRQDAVSFEESDSHRRQNHDID